MHIYLPFLSDSQSLYVASEYLSGGEIFFHMKHERRFSCERSKFYAAQITSAFEHLHKHDIVYRALAPESISLDSNGYLKLTGSSSSSRHWGWGEQKHHFV